MAVLAGSIMISAGAETHRVEDTLHRILSTTHFEHADAFVFTTGMVVTLSDPSGETLSISHRVTDSSRNFGRIADVNSVSRDFCNGLILNFKMEAFATQDEDILFTITEREMTKDQINALAGCKVKVVGDKN
jgi:uncharacterized membrane protein YjjP (DUF1212 family)